MVGFWPHLHKSFDFISATEERPTISLIRSSRPGGRAVHEGNPALLHLTYPSVRHFTLAPVVCLKVWKSLGRVSSRAWEATVSWLGSCLANLIVNVFTTTKTNMITMITIIMMTFAIRMIILIVELAPTGGTIQTLFGWEHHFPLKNKGQFAFLKCEEGCHIPANLLCKKSASHTISGWSPGLVPDWATRHSFVDLGCKEPRENRERCRSIWANNS